MAGLAKARPGTNVTKRLRPPSPYVVIATAYGRRTEAAMADIRVGVIGCTGRMGRMLIAEIVGAEGCVLAGGCAAADSRFIGQDLGELGGGPRLGLAGGGGTRQ